MADNPEILEIIREERSTAESSAKVDQSYKLDDENPSTPPCISCSCKENDEVVGPIVQGFTPEEVEMIVKEKERQLLKEFEAQLEEKEEDLKDKFDYILQNEQIRTTYMLREAHRERQEKITALQGQLECKNLAGLMFVMCAERRKSRLERLRLVEEYTNYIRALQCILSEAQELILYLSRGYKTSARVDDEWRQKMILIIREFQAYIFNYSGGTPESNQYLFDLPALLKTNASIVDNPNEYPCEEVDEEHSVIAESEGSETSEEKRWYEMLEGDCRPFIMMGDMAEFRPPERRQVLGAVKAAKTAPRKWKEYVFNEMFLKDDCSNLNTIKDEFPKRLPAHWETMGVQTEKETSITSMFNSPPRRATAASLDPRGNMGSIIKMISSQTNKPSGKTLLLGARDSMEIASATKLRERHRHSEQTGRVVINVGNRKESLMNQLDQKDMEEEELNAEEQQPKRSDDKDDDDFVSKSLLGVHTDSLQVMPHHIPERDSKINYEKVCPIDKCQHEQMDSFIRSLPPYMRASPFMHYEQTYEDYETCSPEQMEILKQRLEMKKRRDPSQSAIPESPLQEWVAPEEVPVQRVQGSQESLQCTCMPAAPEPTPVSSVGNVYNIADLYPMKKALDEIRKECFFDSQIEFNRFKVIGQENSEDNEVERQHQETFSKRRFSEIKRILKQYPSLCEIFQANTQC